MAGWSPSGAAAMPGDASAAAVAKRPGAVKYEATAVRWYPRAASARTASGTVGVAAEVYAATTGTPPSRSESRRAVRRVSAADSGSREPAEASTTASPLPPGRPPAGHPASRSRPYNASTSSGWGPSGAAIRVRTAGAPAARAGRSCLTW